jgi:threonine/homoserine/homoserine lactone efflux protein
MTSSFKAIWPVVLGIMLGLFLSIIAVLVGAEVLSMIAPALANVFSSLANVFWSRVVMGVIAVAFWVNYLFQPKI